MLDLLFLKDVNVIAGLSTYLVRFVNVFGRYDEKDLVVSRLFDNRWPEPKRSSVTISFVLF